MERFIVVKPFTYLGKKYDRGEYFDPDKYDMPAGKVKTRIAARMIVDMRTLTEKQIRELTAKRPQVKAEPVATPVVDKAEAPVGRSGKRNFSKD